MKQMYENGISVKIAGANSRGQTVLDVVLKPTLGPIMFRDVGLGNYELTQDISEGYVAGTIRKWIRTAKRLRRWIRRCLYE